MNKIIVCGGDERNYHLCRFLIEEGFDAVWLFAEKSEMKGDFIIRGDFDKDNAYAIILPLPLSRDGKTLNTPLSYKSVSLTEIDNFCQNKRVFTSDDSIFAVNYFKDEGVTVSNARLTAVGFLKELLNFEKEDIMNKKALVTGYGRVSKAVCDILQRNGVIVTVAARDSAQRCEAKARGCIALKITEAENNLRAYDYVINTVPSPLFSGESIEKADGNTVFFELASSLVSMAEHKPSAYIECKGMPGKHTPKSAGRVIADFVTQKMRE